MSRTAVSHHLKTLHEAGVLGRDKQGKGVYYWINKAFLIEAMETVVDYIEENV